MPDGDAMLAERVHSQPLVRHKLTIDDFLAMSAGSGRELELVDGELFELPQEGLSHARDVMRVLDLLKALLAGTSLELLSGVAVGYRIHTALGPDLTVFEPAGLTTNYVPAEATRLMFEASHSTLSHDLNFKRRAYARFGCPDYWLLENKQRVLHVFSDPADGDYRNQRTLRAGDTLPCPFAPERTVAVADLLG